MLDKSLSAGTLSLRFMQNVRRPQQQPRPEPELPRVKDDAQWELAPHIRQAWGPTAYRGEKAVTYETSYLPFLFPSLHDTPAADGPSSLSPSNALRPRGRRVFNKRGQEVPYQPSTPTPPLVNTAEQTAKPHSISLGGKPSPTKPSKRSIHDPSKDAKNLIFDIAGVGTDLRQSSSMQGTAFLRPAGVDVPAGPAKSYDPTNPTHSSTGATNSLRQNAKRSRTSGLSDKPKKKTRLTLIE